jgi:hypothetical protein
MGRKKLPSPKGSNYKRPCATCCVPCFGVRCRKCSERVKLDLRTIATKRAGPRNPEWGSGENGKFAVVLTKPVPPSSSWWIEKDFAAAMQRELPRMLAATVSGNAPNVIE